jgi:transcriptional regulator with XRE-family HTH domain
MTGLIDYLSQLDLAAQKAGVRLEDAAKAEGMPRNTVWRWRKGSNLPRQDTAERVLARIERMAAEHAA